MKFSFPKNEPEKILNAIIDELGGRELGKLLQFERVGSDLKVIISKLGTSVFEFKGTSSDAGLEYNLVNEKVAFTHKAFKADVMEKLCRVIEKVGGNVISRG